MMTDPMAANPRIIERKPTVSSVLRTVLLCDWADSTQLIETLGDSRAVILLQEHDQFLRNALVITEGRLIDKADGVLALFERPIQALDFALRYQLQMRLWGKQYQQPIQARTGIHVGDVMTWQNEPDQISAGAKPMEVEGLAKPIAARLMNLAMPGQILMSGMAQSLAQRAQLELGERGQNLRWLVHGRYQFKGVPAPMLVHEVGDPEFSPLRAPTSTQKAWRDIPLWRRPPVLALEVLLSLGLVGGFLYSTFQSPPAIAFYERDWVVLGDVQNRSDEPLFNESLDTTLRLGLEQSAYVNVISDSQEKTALEMMQRKSSQLDRQNGTEVALRTNAKAFVLPTLSKVGGVLRISAEVIDPNTGVTVYSESADAKDVDGVLNATDQVLTSVREKLGESLTKIQKSSKPLEQVTTKNLDALRAYSLGIAAKSRSEMSEAEALFKEAIRLDPEFAMAYSALGLLAYIDNDNTNAKKYIDQADKYRQRFSQREALLHDATLALYSKPSDMLAKLKLLATLYPDEYRAYYNYAYFGHYDASLTASSIKFIQPALVDKNPRLNSAYYLLGLLESSEDNSKAAIEAFKKAKELNVSGELRHFAEAYAVTRDYNQANKVLKEQTATGLAGNDISQSLPLISFAVDQGEWSQGIKETIRLERQAKDISPELAEVFKGIRLSLQTRYPNQYFKTELRDYLMHQQSRLTTADKIEKRHVIFLLAASTWMAASTHDFETANLGIAKLKNISEIPDYPANRSMFSAAKAELLLQEGKPSEAIQLLNSDLSEGGSLYLTRDILMRAYAAKSDYQNALDNAVWLHEHRGLAYGESNSLNMLQPLNLAKSNMSMHAASSFASKLKRFDDSKSYDAIYYKYWPQEKLMPNKQHKF